MSAQDVVVVATGMVAFRKQSTETTDLLAAAAVRDLVRRFDLDLGLVDECYVGSAKGGSLVGQRALRFVGGARGLPVVNVENACASSAVAFHLAHRAISSGVASCVLVIGVDRLSPLGKGTLPVAATEWEGAVGVTNPVGYAMRARRYLDETDATVEDLARVVVKSRAFASQNPLAQMRDETSIEEVLASRTIADPLTLFQCSAKSDGAAASVVMSRELAQRTGRSGPVVRASAVTSGCFSMAARDLVRPDVTSRAVEEAYEQAEMGPGDLDVVELHDAFSIAELMYTEELGLCPPGDAPAHLRSGASSELTSGPHAVVNASGGLLGRGHPIGATGLAQIVECHRQLTGAAGDRQREGARAALMHVTGGGASGFDNGACAVTILTAD